MSRKMVSFRELKKAITWDFTLPTVDVTLPYLFCPVMNHPGCIINPGGKSSKSCRPNRPSSPLEEGDNGYNQARYRRISAPGNPAAENRCQPTPGWFPTRRPIRFIREKDAARGVLLLKNPTKPGQLLLLVAA
jgi:hypothetical protein